MSRCRRIVAPTPIRRRWADEVESRQRYVQRLRCEQPNIDTEQACAATFIPKQIHQTSAVGIRDVAQELKPYGNEYPYRSHTHCSQAPHWLPGSLSATQRTHS